MESILIDIFIFLLGLVIGSFLNCVIYRIEVNRSFINDRSICPKCKHVLAWRDLLPVLSFFLLKGRCRYCKQPISWQYPSVELLTAILFVWIFNYFALPLAIFNVVIACLLVIVFIYDLKHFIIPDRITFSAIGLVLIYDLALIVLQRLSQWQIISLVSAAAGAGMFFFLIYAISRGKWMGFGDVKLALFMGLFLGFPNILLALLFAFGIGGIIGIILVFLKKKSLKSEVPFGPFLVMGTFIALFWGEKIIKWYLNLFQI